MIEQEETVVTHRTVKYALGGDAVIRHEERKIWELEATHFRTGVIAWISG